MQTVNRDVLVILLVLGVGGCKGPEDSAGPFEEAGETDGDEGIHVPDIDLPGDDEDPVLLTPGECLQAKFNNVYGYTHQCEGQIQLQINVQGDLLEEFFTFGPGQTNPQYWTDPDSYELPLVAACCGPFNYGVATLEQKLPYLNNCLLDSAQQICHGLPYFLRRQAQQAQGPIEKAVINNLADDVEAREDECMLALWSGGPTEDAPSRLVGTTWSPVNDVTITLVESEVSDWTVEGDVIWDTCETIYDNDPAVIPTAPFDVPGSIATTKAKLGPGTTMKGSGPAGVTATIVPTASESSLTVAHMTDGSLRVVGLQLEAGPALVGTSDLSLVLERSSLGLREVMTPRSAGGEHVVGAGDARFVVTTTFDGGSRTVVFTSVDPIVFRETSAGDWEFEPFELVYDEPDVGVWVLSFDGMLFQAEL